MSDDNRVIYIRIKDCETTITARIYQTQLNGAMIKIDTDKYDFITDKSGCYDIRQLKAETREFDIITADGTTIHTIVNFPA